MNSAKIVRLIETHCCGGAGTYDDPRRTITQWWTLDGKLVTQSDPYTVPILESELKADKTRIEQLIVAVAEKQKELDAERRRPQAEPYGKAELRP